MKILITGVAGFIGFHVCQKLLQLGHTILGIDNLNTYYDPTLKQARLNQLTPHPNFQFLKLDLNNTTVTAQTFADFQPDIVIHLAAQAGVRYSLENPHAYVDSNIVGFLNILEGCRHHPVQHLIYASSSSVYGANTKVPFAVGDPVEQPISLYAATKRANELMAYTYSHLYQIPTTGLRFFTVYGEWGRPDMAYFSFTQAILDKKPIRIFNHGKMRRDFTYIDDIVEGISRLCDRPPSQGTPHSLYNIGNNKPVDLLCFISVLENCLGVKADKEFLPMQPGDLAETFADIDDLIGYIDFKPETAIEVGLSRFVDWYREYYQLF